VTRSHCILVKILGRTDAAVGKSGTVTKSTPSHEMVFPTDIIVVEIPASAYVPVMVEHGS